MEILKPVHCYFITFNCAKNKGRKAESIQRDLRQVFVRAATFAPSVVVLENIDILTKFNPEHTQDGEYYQQ
jgi:AAA+ superfamily predicted ATPase